MLSLKRIIGYRCPVCGAWFWGRGSLGRAQVCANLPVPEPKYKVGEILHNGVSAIGIIAFSYQRENARHVPVYTYMEVAKHLYDGGDKWVVMSGRCSYLTEDELRLYYDEGRLLPGDIIST